MQKIKLIILPLLIIACSNEGRYTKAENPLDAAREFIRASLDGDYRRAAFYLYKDSTNLMLFEKQESNYLQLRPEEKNNYRDASIRIIETKTVNDSTTTYKYYHSSNVKDTTSIRVVKYNNNWLVDLKSVIKM